MIYVLGDSDMDKKNEVPDVSDSSDDENESPDSTGVFNLWYDLIYVVMWYVLVMLWCDL